MQPFEGGGCWAPLQQGFDAVATNLWRSCILLFEELSCWTPWKYKQGVHQGFCADTGLGSNQDVDVRPQKDIDNTNSRAAWTPPMLCKCEFFWDVQRWVFPNLLQGHEVPFRDANSATQFMARRPSNVRTVPK